MPTTNVTVSLSGGKGLVSPHEIGMGDWVSAWERPHICIRTATQDRLAVVMDPITGRDYSLPSTLSFVLLDQVNIEVSQ